MMHSLRLRAGLGLSASLVLMAVAAGCGDESGGGSSGDEGEGGAGVTATSGPGATSGNGSTSGTTSGAGAGSSTSGGSTTSGNPTSGPSTVTSSGTGGDGGGAVDPCEGVDPNSLYAQTAVDFSTLQTVNLCAFQGEVLLIANIAANCGYTYQMSDLQYLETHFGPQGFRVLGFISNDFGGQAGTTEEIQACNAEHGITFQEYDRAPVATDPQPVFAWLQAQPNPGPEASLVPTWNFNKYVISRSGQLVGKFSEHEAWGTDSTAPAFDASLAVQKIREQIALD